MQKIISINTLRETLKQWRYQGQSIAFVPTMGNLHTGHIKLVTEAQKKADKVVVSVFVNPTQFGVGEDFESYPRTEQADTDKLENILTDVLFLPNIAELYQKQNQTTVSVSELSTLYCGASRLGHFEGVATIVTKLFNIVQPDLAIFGEKDFQQLVIIRQLVEDLNSPVKILGVPTVRESDGLALSSRNGYLTEQQRLIAPKLYESLCQARHIILSGEPNLRMIEQQQQKYLNSVGFDLDYFSICHANNLHLAKEAKHNDKLVILAAAQLGKPRLIDNILVNLID